MAKDSTQRRKGLRNVAPGGLAQNLPTSVQKSYFMLSDAQRAVLNTALGKYRPGQSEPIGKNLLKPALRLMTNYRLVVEEIDDAEAVTSYTRWVDAVQVKGAENQEVYLTFSPRFEHIWLESKKSLLEFAGQKPANIGLRSRYALRMYGWAKKHVSAGTKRIALEQLRTVLGLDSVKDVKGNVIREGRLVAWANFRHRALNVAIAEINKKTDLNIALKSLEQAEYGRVATLIFSIRSQSVTNADSKGKRSS